MLQSEESTLALIFRLIKLPYLLTWKDVSVLSIYLLRKLQLSALFFDEIPLFFFFTVLTVLKAEEEGGKHLNSARERKRKHFKS